MGTHKRREFLSKSLIGISGAALLPSNLKIVPGSANDKSLSSELPTRLLGKTDIKIPLISFGTSGALDTGFIRSAYETGI